MKCCWWYKQPILRWKTFQELKKQLKRSLILRLNINHHSLKETCQFYCGIHKMALIEHALNINKKKKMYWIDCLPSTHQCSFKPENRFSLYTLQYAFENARFRNQANCQTDNLTFSAVMVLTLFLTHGEEWQYIDEKSHPASDIPLKVG